MPTRESTEPESGGNFYDAINCLKVAADEMELGTECLVAGIMQDENLTAADRQTLEKLRDRLERFTDWFELPKEVKS